LPGIWVHNRVLLEVEWDEICWEPKVEEIVLVYHKTDVLGLQAFLWEKFNLWGGNGKEMQKPLCLIDYNCNLWEVNLKDQLLHMYVVKRKMMTKWYLKLFKRLLNSTVLNSINVYRQVTERNIEQLPYRIQLVEDLFMKHASAAGKQSVPGQHASNNTIPRLTKRQFLRKVAPKTEKSKSQRRCVVCSEHRKRNFHCTAVKYVMWSFVSKTAVSCTTRSSITKAMKIIILHLHSFKIFLLKF
jgi:hypothetical protein